MLTCTVSWFCVNLYSKLVLSTLVQWASNSRSAKGSVFVCVCLCRHTFCTKLAQWLYKVCQLITQSLYKSKSNLSWAAHKNLRSACSYSTGDVDYPSLFSSASGKFLLLSLLTIFILLWYKHQTWHNLTFLPYHFIVTFEGL